MIQVIFPSRVFPERKMCLNHSYCQKDTYFIRVSCLNIISAELLCVDGGPKTICLDDSLGGLIGPRKNQQKRKHIWDEV